MNCKLFLKETFKNDLSLCLSFSISLSTHPPTPQHAQSGGYVHMHPLWRPWPAYWKPWQVKSKLYSTFLYPSLPPSGLLPTFFSPALPFPLLPSFILFHFMSMCIHIFAYVYVLAQRSEVNTGNHPELFFYLILGGRVYQRNPDFANMASLAS